MSALEERISAVLANCGGPYTNGDQTASACECGWEGSDPNQTWTGHIAQLISSLFTEQTNRYRGIHTSTSPELSRWVTDWWPQ